MTTTRTYTAKFPKAAMADEFAERLLANPAGDYATDITHTTGRRTVTWSGPATGEYRLDMAETVGYYGSPPMGPVATLNGFPTPRSY